jgi:tetratricopeptide (TPR) repeat protein
MQEPGSIYSRPTMAHRPRDAASGQACSTREGHVDNIYPVALSPDGNLVASASYGSTVEHNWTRNMDDLERAITYAQEALAATPLDHPDRAGRLSELYASLVDRYNQAGSMSDLEQALTHAQDALAATPDDYPNRASRLNNLSICFESRYRRTGSISDLKQALAYT